MQSAKEDVSKLLATLPDDCSLEDIQYHLSVLQKVERGTKDYEEGRTVSQEEIEKRMSRWTGRQSGPPRQPGTWRRPRSI